MTTLEQIVMEKTGINMEQMKKLEQFSEEPVSNGSYDADFERPVTKGEGTYDLTKKTYYVTIRGWVMITAPEGGTWDIIAYDDGKEIFRRKGIVNGQKVEFGPYKTNWTTKLHVEFSWSEKRDTTLKGHVHIQY